MSRLNAYFISDPSYYHDITSFASYLDKVFSRNEIDYACFRDKISLDILPYAKTFLTYAKRYKIKNILINTHINLAFELGFDGVHLNSRQFDQIQNAKEKKLLTIISTHRLDEVLNAQEKGADGVTLSPIFATPDKGKPQGITFLKQVLKKSSIDIFALGGVVSKEEIALLSHTKVYGFASIRYFV